MNTEVKICLFCSKPLRRRTDKKFCNDYCRSGYNNRRLNGNNNAQLRSINNALRSNWRILEGFLPDTSNSIEILRETLISKGFQFRYFTHIHKSKEGKIFYCCYNYRYICVDDKLVIVRQEATATYNPSISI